MNPDGATFRGFLNVVDEHFIGLVIGVGPTLAFPLMGIAKIEAA